LIFVKFSNDIHVIVNIVGTIHFSEQLVIHNILYIPKFTHNTIFIQCLTVFLNFQLIFSHTHGQI